MNEMCTAVRQAMKLLGYTNQSLAEELSSVRSDGQRTSPATISRWTSGSLPVEPALVLYLKERLAHKYHEGFHPRLPQVKKIAIGGGKGGSGSTTIAKALAVAARELGYRVLLQTDCDACNSHYLTSEKASNLEVVGQKGAVNCEEYDFVFFDVPSRVFTQPTDWQNIITSISEYDLVIVPANIAFLPDAKVAFKAFNFLDSTSVFPPWRILHSDRDFHIHHFEKVEPELAQWRNRLLPRALTYNTEPVQIKQKFFTHEWGFTSEEMSKKYYTLLNDICNILDVELPEPKSFCDVRRLSMEELIGGLIH